MMGNYLKENNVKVKDGTDVNSIMRDMMSIILEVHWIRNWMRNWAIPSMITAISKPTIPGMAILRKRCIPAMETWRLIFPAIVKVSLNPRS